MRFTELLDDQRLLRAVAALGFEEARPVQAAVLPKAMEGRDVIALAPTGTGKTLAYGLPLAARLLDTRPPRGTRGRIDPRTRLRGLVICPTRELAQQVGAEISQLLRGLVPTVLVATGKSAITPQKAALAKGVDLLVGTPGRLRELLEADAMTLAYLMQVVIDEGDRMLDLGFLPQVRWILERTAAGPQRMLFSATLPSEVDRLAAEFLRDPVRAEVGLRNAVAEHLTHRLYDLTEDLKVPLLLSLLGEAPERVLVFARTRRRVGWVATALRRHGLRVGMLHGDRTNRQRQDALAGFTAGRLGVLVATDVAARGLHVPGIRLVVNYDLPVAPEDWVHRVGRAAHGGGEGGSISFRDRRDAQLWQQIATLADVSVEPDSLPRGVKPRPQTPRRISADASTHDRGAGRKATQREAANSPRTPTSRSSGPKRKKVGGGSSSESVSRSGSGISTRSPQSGSARRSSKASRSGGASSRGTRTRRGGKPVRVGRGVTRPDQ